MAAKPLLEIGAVRVHLARWPLVRSLGKDVEVTAIAVRGPVVRLVRLADGALSYADVAARIAAEEPAPERERKARVGRVAITGATVELHDLSRDVEHGGVHLALERIDAEVPVARPDAAVLAPAQNLHLEIGLAPRDEPAKGPLGRVRRAAVRLAKVAIDPLLPFVPRRGGFGVAGATLSIDARLARSKARASSCPSGP